MDPEPPASKGLSSSGDVRGRDTDGADRCQGVAAFDFDGTLARQDTMVPFLAQTHGWPRLALHAALAAPKSRAGGTGFRDALKVATVGRLFRGTTTADLARLGASYAESLDHLLRPELLERLSWHQAEGHATVIVSASLAAYLRPVAEKLNMDAVLAVELVADSAGVLTGEIEGGLNTRGEHKVTRLQEWLRAQFGAEPAVELWAYGDSSGDKDLLASADHPTWVTD